MRALLRLAVLGTERVATHALPCRGEVTIGRDPRCDINVVGDDVADVHARLACDQLTIEDLGSEAGTWIRGERATTGVPIAIGHGEVIRLGTVSIAIQRVPPPAVAANEEIADNSRRTWLSTGMRQVYELVERVAVGTISVLVLGETGVGKEVLAEAIHRRSPRANAPFVRLSCAALSETLIESELFGYERGAFTGATGHKIGLLESADSGTVFLDEIGELSSAMQVKLLRVIESREVMRVGALRPRVIDVRFISATHRDLEARVHAGAFREDLYFRLSGVAIEIPPLRERLDEIDLLAHHFASASTRLLGRRSPTFTAAAVARLRAHGWPGNIRELRNCVERAVLLADSERIDAHHISVSTRPRPVSDNAGEVPPPRVVVHGRAVVLDREQIVTALAQAAGNQKVAAQILRISRRTLINKLEVFGIDRPRKGRG